MKRIGICAKHTSDEALAYAAGVARSLRERGFTIVLDVDTAAALRDDTSVTLPKPALAADADLLITFGGDGTLLSVARHAPGGVPVIGVNMGTLGFLTEIRLEEFPAVLEKVLDNDYLAESRLTLDVIVNGTGRDPVLHRVLNDAVVNKSALARIVEMRISAAGRFVSTFRADGMIISTPTGSTAYNLSAGGPIIYPTMGAIVITPICPHMLSNRPIVLPDTCDVEIGLQEPHEEIYLTLDGQEGFPLTGDEKITIRRSKHDVRLVHSPDKNYFDVLRNKLKWGEGS
ncbi:MAG: NAD(+)/NADH kinase [Thermoanaerobaculia bacterium]